MDQIIVVVGMAFNFILAQIVKKNAGTATSIKKLIPILNIMVGAVTQLIASINQTVPDIAPAVAMAGFFGSFGKGLLDILVNGLIQGLIVTGAHSTQKNVRQF